MDRETLMLSNIEIEKNKFYHHKTIFFGDVDIGEKRCKCVIVLYFKYFTCIMIIKLNH